MVPKRLQGKCGAYKYSYNSTFNDLGTREKLWSDGRGHNATGKHNGTFEHGVTPAIKHEDSWHWQTLAIYTGDGLEITKQNNRHYMKVRAAKFLFRAAVICGSARRCVVLSLPRETAIVSL